MINEQERFVWQDDDFEIEPPKDGVAVEPPSGPFDPIAAELEKEG